MLAELLRERALQNFGVSFSIISVITGIPSLFLFGLVSIPIQQAVFLVSDGK
jgi:hypothetical protein